MYNAFFKGCNTRRAGIFLPQTVAVETVKQSDRLETQRLTAIPDEESYLRWPGVNNVPMLERRVARPQKGDAWSQVVYGITSLAYTPALSHQLLAWTRGA